MPYASVSSFHAVKERGGTTILNHVNADFRTENEVFKEEGALQETWPEPFVSRTVEELELADHILAPSTFVRDDLVGRGVPWSKVIVLPYGVDTARFKPSPVTQPPNRPFTVLHVGQIGHRKGLRYLADAFRLIAPTSYRLRVAGPLTKNGEDILGRYERTEYLGKLDHPHLALEYARADVFVLPSLAEGNGTRGA